jgi:outer membrane protein OmpA-like peptidoglycan-associated protein
MGIGEDRITATGYGESKPIASNDTKEGRQQNRRIDVVLVK